MANEVPFIELGGVEVANGARTLTYLQKLGPSAWEIGGTGCTVQNREAAAPVSGIFVSPTADPAPWYDAAVPESAEFMGLLCTTIDWLNVVWTRSVSQRGGSLGGSNVGPALVAGRGVKVKGALTAITPAGLEYGRAWLQEILRGGPACAAMVARLRDACPPNDGSNDTRGEWILYDVACTTGLVTPDPDFRCTDLEEVTFTLVASLPDKYKRPTTVQALTAIPQSRVMGPAPRGTVTDDFTRANTGPPPSASWTSKVAPSDNATNLVVSSNTLKANTGLIGPAWWNSATVGRDHQVSVTIATADNASGQTILYARLQSPGNAQVSGFMATIWCNGTNSFCRMYSCQDGSALFTPVAQLHQTNGLVFAASDVLCLAARGPAVEVWHVRPSTGVATRLGVCYDQATGDTQDSLSMTGGVAMASTTLALDNFTLRGISSQAAIPLPTLDPIVVDLGAPKVGSTGLILTLDNTLEIYQPINNLRVIRKAATPAQVSFTDDFATNKLATKWFKRQGPTTPFNVTGGQLKPLAAALGQDVREAWSQDGTFNGIRPASRMMARMTFHTGASVTAGSWGVTIAVGEDLMLLAHLTPNFFRLSTILAQGGTENVAFQTAVTPAINTTYVIVAERTYQGAAAAWLTTLGGDVIANLFMGVPNGFFSLNTVPSWGAGFRVVPVGTDEWYDDFYAADVGPEVNTMTVGQLPPYDSAILDSARHVLTWTDYDPLLAASTIRDGAGILELSTWTGSLVGPQFGWQETNGEQESSLIIPHQGGLSIDQPPKYSVQLQSHRG